MNKLIKLKDFLLKGLSPAMRWALLATLVVALGFAVIGLAIMSIPYGIGTFLAFLGIFLGAGLVAATLITLLFVAFKKMRWQTFMVLLLTIMLAITAFFLAIYLVYVLIFLMITVYLAVMFVTKQYKDLRTYKKVLRAVGLSASALVLLAFSFIIFWPGPALSPDMRPDVARLALPHPQNFHQPQTVPLANPGLAGNYEFDVHFYNIPNAVDASKMLHSWGNARYRNLGFDYSAMPLNAQVWVPRGAGPFPIALIVHGNHTAGVNSYDGYGYLGEHLASRGIIAASVDQTFLNGSFGYDLMGLMGGLSPENGVRGFVLLEHLQQWYDWNNDPNHEFFGLVDFERTVLIGHSRGGEAVALAAAFADMTHYPSNGMMEFNFPFSINTAIAIAPTHRQYDPAGLEVYLTGVNYLAIHGGHDKDVFSFMGADMYRRVCVADEGIKARVWLQHANHGQFNSIWVNDASGLMSMIGNRRMRMNMDEQKMAGKVLIGAFLEATLFDRQEYTNLFRYFTHGEEWLPATYYVIDFMDSTIVLLDDFENSFNLTHSTTGLVAYTAHDLSSWTIVRMPGRINNHNRVLQLQWGDENQNPTFTMNFADGTVGMGDIIYMSLTTSTQANIGFYLRLTDVSGNTAQIHVDDLGGVPSPIVTPLFTPIFQLIAGDYEPVLQILPIPSNRFTGLQGEIATMELIMDTAITTKTLFIDDLRVSR